MTLAVTALVSRLAFPQEMRTSLLHRVAFLASRGFLDLRKNREVVTVHIAKPYLSLQLSLSLPFHLLSTLRTSPV